MRRMLRGATSAVLALSLVPVASPQVDEIADFLVGRSDDPTGLDLTGDGKITVEDLVLALGPLPGAPSLAAGVVPTFTLTSAYGLPGGTVTLDFDIADGGTAAAVNVNLRFNPVEIYSGTSVLGEAAEGFFIAQNILVDTPVAGTDELRVIAYADPTAAFAASGTIFSTPWSIQPAAPLGLFSPVTFSGQEGVSDILGRSMLANYISGGILIGGDPPPVVVSPEAALLFTGECVQITAHQHPLPDPDVTWSLRIPDGVISPEATFGRLIGVTPHAVTYEAPALLPPESPVHVRATVTTGDPVTAEAVIFVLAGSAGPMSEDATGDGVVDDADIRIDRGALLGEFDISPPAAERLDANRDGRLDAADLTTTVNAANND